MKAEGWYVVDHDKDDAVVRGPYEGATEAWSVRRELERRGRGHYSNYGNLWIVSHHHWDEPEHPVNRGTPAHDLDGYAADDPKRAELERGSL